MAFTQLIATLLFIAIITASQTLNFGEKDLTFHPDSPVTFYIHGKELVNYQLSDSLIDHIQQTPSSLFYIGIIYDRKDTYLTKIIGVITPDSDLEYDKELYYRALPVHFSKQLNNDTNSHSSFTVKVIGVGYAEFYVELVEVKQNNETEVIVSKQYEVKAVREQRLVDLSFDIAITILAILNTFAIGCVTELQLLKQQLRKKQNLLTAIVTQYIIIPLICFGLTRAFRVENEVALGFLYVSCMPGGGLGHLIVAITSDTDLELSIALNAFQLIFPIAVVPTLVYSLAQALPNYLGLVEKDIYYLVFWNVALMVPYIAGIILRRKKETVAFAFLNWLIKPILLLAFILFITLGLYINMYMFSVLDNSDLVMGGMIPFIGFGIGGGLTFITKQSKAAAKTIAIEAAIMNCIAAIVALRFTLPEPEADLATAAVMWVFFFTPVPFLLMFIFHRIKKKIMSYFEKKEFEKEQQDTMLQSFAAITHNALQIGGIASINSSPIYHQQVDTNDICDQTMLIRSTSHGSDPSRIIANNAAMEMSGHSENFEDKSLDTLVLEFRQTPQQSCA